MCGIAGIVSPDKKNVTKQRLKGMADTLRHRGPDGEGFWLSEEGIVGFAHRRLSIIDLSNAGAQPMHYQDRYSITYNGEIYNYLELRETLIKKGYSFSTHTDTEVVLAAYACFGVDCPQYFDGMFAFAIWDEQEKLLFCARDHFGEKPFYYSYPNTDKQFLFASEMKALWAAGLPKKMDDTMLLNYLTLGWMQNPVNKQQTFFQEIYSLPPAHYLLYYFKYDKEPLIELCRYWDLDKQSQLNNPDPKAVKERFLELFTQSVRVRLRSDVAIGSSLSGGLDSSSIVAVINNIRQKAGGQKTFSAVFPGFEKDESAEIRQVVQHLQVDNYQVSPTADNFINDFEKLTYHQEEPYQSTSIYAQYKVYELAKQHNVTVILDGQGADEVLAGYTKYYHWFWQEKIASGKRKEAWNEIASARQNGQTISWGFKNYLAAYLPQVAANGLQKNMKQILLHNPNITQAFLESAYDKTTIYKPAVYNLNDILYFNTMEFGLEELLRFADRNSMAHSREVRLPFLNHELVQFIFSLSSAYKIKDGFTKYIQRLSIQNHLPASVVWRKDKVGYEPPQKQWMQQPKFQEYVHESKRKLVDRRILKPQVLQKEVTFRGAHEADNFDWRYLCVAQCM